MPTPSKKNRNRNGNSNNTNNNPLSRIQVNRNDRDSSSAARRARWEAAIEERQANERDQARWDANQGVHQHDLDLAIHSSDQIITELQERFPQYSVEQLQMIVNNYLNNIQQRNRITGFMAYTAIAEQLSRGNMRNEHGTVIQRRRRKSRNTRRNRF